MSEKKINNRERKYTLKEIAQWADIKTSEVKIPDLQRGLVWKPRQMELLWDSMLRGFPVGSFILSDAADGTFFLMDGQQRYNAIARGFDDSMDNGVMLWLDIHPGEIKNSTRVFWVKSTTKAHPWGFKNNDDCSPLTSKERRDALVEFGMPSLNIYKNHFWLGETWPVEAEKPVPLHFFLLAPLDDEYSFAEYIHAKSAERGGLPYTDLNEDDLLLIREKFYPVFKELGSYTIQCDVLPRTVVERESEGKEATDEATPMEVLFNRLNTGGTRISQDDLNYSAIKAYWGKIKERNDLIAQRYMSPSKLVMLAFRLALTQMDVSKGLRNPLSVRQIRALANNPRAKAEIDLIYDRLEEIMSRIDSWLKVFDPDSHLDANAMPAFIRTSIARNSPDVFLLLMYLADMDINGGKEINPAEVRAMALILHWFSQDKKNAAGTLFTYINESCDSCSLRMGLSECFSRNYILPIYSPAEMHQFIRVIQDPKWTPWIGNDYAPWCDFYSRMSTWDNNPTAQEMLLYAQRIFINTRFRLYDPAREDMWEEHNRPWDYDHIIPRNWITERGRRRGEYRDFCNHWVSRIGNIAAIPFEDNRSKGDRDAYSIYENNASELLFYPEFIDVSRAGKSLPDNPQESFSFAQLSLKRTFDIYGKCYELFSPIIQETCLTDRQIRRKLMIEYLASTLSSSEIVFVARGGSLWRDYPIMRDADWTREWISVGVRQKGKYFVSFTWGCNDQDHLEVGIRKLPGTDISNDNSDLPEVDSSYWTGIGDWWYAEKDVPIDSTKETILIELDKLIELFNNE